MNNEGRLLFTRSQGLRRRTRSRADASPSMGATLSNHVTFATVASMSTLVSPGLFRNSN